MKRDTIYTIGRRTFEAQQVGDKLNVKLADGRYYDILFGVDSKGVRYMALVLEEWGTGEWHGAYKSGGHWHGAGYNIFVKGYNVKLRKNFKDADEANHYYTIVKTKMFVKTVQDEEDPARRFTEDFITKFFA